MRPLTPDEEARAQRLHAEAFVFAAHTDFIAGVSEGRSRGERAVASRLQLPLLRAGGVKAVCEHVAGDTPYFSTLAFRNIRCMEQWPAELYRQLWANTEMAALEFRYPPEFDSLAKCGNVTRGLVARGYDDAAIRGIMGDNMRRLFEAVLPAT